MFCVYDLLKCVTVLIAANPYRLFYCHRLYALWGKVKVEIFVCICVFFSA